MSGTDFSRHAKHRCLVLRSGIQFAELAFDTPEVKQNPQQPHGVAEPTKNDLSFAAKRQGFRQVALPSADARQSVQCVRFGIAFSKSGEEVTCATNRGSG